MSPRAISKLLLHLITTSLVLIGILVTIVLNPGLAYAHKTVLGNYTVYHNTTLDPLFQHRLNQATKLIRTSELYDPNAPMTICLNDQSAYPALIGLVQGPAFGYGFANKVVISGQTNVQRNYVQVNGYKWNLTALLAHEMTHCLQVHRFGLLGSNPIADYPRWKWEGYAEYVARQQSDQQSVLINIERFAKEEQTQDWGIPLADGTCAPKAYYKDWLRVQYCLGIRQMTYAQLLSDSTREALIDHRMRQWYQHQRSVN